MPDATPVGILLAAGSALRFGSDKLLYPLSHGVPMAVVAAKKLNQVCKRCITVIRPEQSALQALLLAEGFEVHLNAQSAQGMGRSLALAVSASPSAAAWLVALADMPWVSMETYALVVKKLGEVGGIVAPTYEGHRGHPVGFSHAYYEQLIRLQGDQGARALVSGYPQATTLISTDDRGILIDVDTPQDLV